MSSNVINDKDRVMFLPNVAEILSHPIDAPQNPALVEWLGIISEMEANTVIDRLSDEIVMTKKQQKAFRAAYSMGFARAMDYCQRACAIGLDKLRWETLCKEMRDKTGDSSQDTV